MPNFSINPGGFGVGASVKNAHFSVVVLEKYVNGNVGLVSSVYHSRCQ